MMLLRILPKQWQITMTRLFLNTGSTWPMISIFPILWFICYQTRCRSITSSLLTTSHFRAASILFYVKKKTNILWKHGTTIRDRSLINAKMIYALITSGMVRWAVLLFSTIPLEQRTVLRHQLQVISKVMIFNPGTLPIMTLLTNKIFQQTFQIWAWFLR